MNAAEVSIRTSTGFGSAGTRRGRCRELRVPGQAEDVLDPLGFERFDDGGQDYAATRHHSITAAERPGGRDDLVDLHALDRRGARSAGHPVEPPRSGPRPPRRTTRPRRRRAPPGARDSAAGSSLPRPARAPARIACATGCSPPSSRRPVVQPFEPRCVLAGAGRAGTRSACPSTSRPDVIRAFPGRVPERMSDLGAIAEVEGRSGRRRDAGGARKK